MRFKLNIFGFAEVKDYFLDLSGRADVSITRVLNFVVQSTGQRAKNLIRTGIRTGRIYEFSTGLHQASAPGEPPANLSGKLAASIRWTFITDLETSTAIVGTDLEYGRMLEFGGINSDGRWVDARPWLFPSVMAALKNAEKELVQEFKKTR